MTKEDLIHEPADDERKDERLEIEHGHAGARFGQVHDRRIELLLLVESIADDERCGRHTACKYKIGSKASHLPRDHANLAVYLYSIKECCFRVCIFILAFFIII